MLPAEMLIRSTRVSHLLQCSHTNEHAYAESSVMLWSKGSHSYVSFDNVEMAKLAIFKNKSDQFIYSSIERL